jgi:hypothetical protein
MMHDCMSDFRIIFRDNICHFGEFQTLQNAVRNLRRYEHGNDRIQRIPKAEYDSAEKDDQTVDKDKHLRHGYVPVAKVQQGCQKIGASGGRLHREYQSNSRAADNAAKNGRQQKIIQLKIIDRNDHESQSKGQHSEQRGKQEFYTLCPHGQQEQRHVTQHIEQPNRKAAVNNADRPLFYNNGKAGHPARNKSHRFIDQVNSKSHKECSYHDCHVFSQYQYIPVFYLFC